MAHSVPRSTLGLGEAVALVDEVAVGAGASYRASVFHAPNGDVRLAKEAKALPMKVPPRHNHRVSVQVVRDGWRMAASAPELTQGGWYRASLTRDTSPWPE